MGEKKKKKNSVWLHDTVLEIEEEKCGVTYRDNTF
jgi:hypothetical protein